MMMHQTKVKPGGHSPRENDQKNKSACEQEVYIRRMMGRDLAEEETKRPPDRGHLGDVPPGITQIEIFSRFHTSPIREYVRPAPENSQFREKIRRFR